MEPRINQHLVYSTTYHAHTLDQLDNFRKFKKKTAEQIDKQKQIAREKRASLKKYTENPKLAAKYGSDGLYLTAKQKKAQFK